MNNCETFIFHSPKGLGPNADKIIYGDLTHLIIFTPNTATQLLKLLGFMKISYFETEPYARNIKGTIRLILWKLIKFGVNMIRFVGTVTTEKILTQNFIVLYEKNE